MIELAHEIYNTLADMDLHDYEETRDNTLKDLTKDLELLNRMGSGALLNAIKMLFKD